MEQEEIVNSESLEILGTLFVGVSTARILDFLLAYRDFDYSEADIARHAGISAKHLYRVLPILETAGLVYTTGREGRKKKYRLDMNSKAVYHLERMVFALIDKKSKMTEAKPTFLEAPELLNTTK